MGFRELLPYYKINNPIFVVNFFLHLSKVTKNNMLIHKNKYLIIIISILLLSSCASRKKMAYFQGELENVEAKNYTPTLVKDDLLAITVMGLDPEAVKPFNMPVTDVSSRAMGGYTQGTPTPPGYLIDADGNIDFPVIGQIKLAGLTRSEAKNLLQEKLAAYVNNPIVNIRILNFKVTVLGDVKSPGTFTIPNERISLPEALGIAGDLNITGERQNIIVIRDVDGKKTQYEVDLTSKELFSSPVYYLNQNDVVYVEPNRAKRNSSAINPGNASVMVSAISLVVSVLILLTR